MRPVCEVRWLGRVDYGEAWGLQRDLATARAAGEIPDTLLLLEHSPVFTTGKRTAESNLRLPADRLGAPLVVSDRGGDITFHGPGQLIAYPIIDMRAAGLGVVNYVRNLEEVIIRTLRDFGIESGLECGLTGVWVGNEKIAAIGVRVSRLGGASGGWVTTHGVALNVDVDLAWFERIVPCGISDRGVTSMLHVLGKAPAVSEVADPLVTHFGDVFQRDMSSAVGMTLPARRSAVV
ncbi:MAG: lipoyl(octanoyl) transferase LipB [Chloroflexi bacterium]|nr:MAG: lipoyl(octanoyl) transferase LipB [Chloroflexota bacterium]